MTSCIDCPRTLAGDCSPIAHSTASVMFDLPEPFGPTITETPGENSSRVRSGNDLKPLRLTDLRCMSRSEPVEGDRSRRLLGLLLRTAGAARQLGAGNLCGDLEGPLVRWALLADDLVD